MKNIFLKISLIIALVALIVTSCQKEEVDPSNTEFAIKDINGEVLASLPLDLLSSIHKDLILTGRNDDAKTLYELYDTINGNLRASGINNELTKVSLSAMKVDSSNMIITHDTLSLPLFKSWQQPYVYLYAHCQDYGDIGPFQQAPNSWNYTHRPYFAGTTGESKRLEGMWLQTAQFLASTRPDIKYLLINPNGTTTSTGTWGQFVGTRGQSKAVIGLEMWSDTPGIHIWYIAHNQNTGWSGGWHNDGQFAGTYGKRLEAYAMQILQY